MTMCQIAKKTRLKADYVVHVEPIPDLICRRASARLSMLLRSLYGCTLLIFTVSSDHKKANGREMHTPRRGPCPFVRTTLRINKLVCSPSSMEGTSTTRRFFFHTCFLVAVFSAIVIHDKRIRCGLLRCSFSFHD